MHPWQNNLGYVDTDYKTALLLKTHICIYKIYTHAFIRITCTGIKLHYIYDLYRILQLLDITQI